MNDGDGPRGHRIRLAGLQQAASCVREGEDDRLLKAGPEFARLGDVERELWQSHDPSRQRRQADAWDCAARLDRAQRHPIERRQAGIIGVDRDERWLMARATLGRCWRKDETDGRQTSAHETQDRIRGQSLEHQRGQDTGGPGKRGRERGGD